MVDFDDIKVLGAATGGIGNWMLHIDVILQIGISLASLVYIVLKIMALMNRRK